MKWSPISTVPKDRYVLLLRDDTPAWDGNMDVGRWFDDERGGCFWSSGGPNGGLELNMQGWGKYTHWMELPSTEEIHGAPAQDRRET
jgi:hypothetical protein